VDRQLTAIVVAIIASSLVLGCTFLPRTGLTQTSGGDTLSKTFEWKYSGRTYTWEVPISAELLKYYRAMPRSRDYSEYVKDSHDDQYLGLLCGKLSQAEVESDWSGKIDFILAFVQSLNYAPDEVTGFDEYPRYPIETLVEEGGDCEDTSILFASIVGELGYGTVLLRFDDSRHMASGVRISEDVIADWPKGYSLTYYEDDGKYYAYCETTGSGWRIGEKPEWVTDRGAVIIRL
jgi:hypothetical protein